MLLADVLALASRKIINKKIHSNDDQLSPKLLIDFATLTGLFLVFYNFIYF
jgi:leucyl aminopeptidase